MKIFSITGTGRVQVVTVSKIDEELDVCELDCDEVYLPVRDLEDDDGVLVYAKRVLREVTGTNASSYILGFTDDEICITFECSKDIPTDEDLNLVVEAISVCTKYVNDLCPKCGSKLLKLSTGTVCMRCEYQE